MEKAERLRMMRIFKDFGDEEINRVAKIALEKIYPAGVGIIKEGELGEGLFAIVEGEVCVNKRLAKTGAEETLAVLKPGDHFGEMALIDGKPASATVIADKPTICFVVKRKDYNALISNEPIIAMKLYRFYAASLCERLRKTDAFILEELSRNKKSLSAGILDASV